ncbi:hypothetical protein B0H13DRAFT_1562887, partial [Mycena leptocephala]
LTPEEIDLVCGVYVVATADEDGLQKKAISWWPKPGSFFSSGLYIGWWSSDCERWFQKRLAELQSTTVKAKLWTQTQWKN